MSLFLMDYNSTENDIRIEELEAAPKKQTCWEAFCLYLKRVFQKK